MFLFNVVSCIFQTLLRMGLVVVFLHSLLLPSCLLHFFLFFFSFTLQAFFQFLKIFVWMYLYVTIYYLNILSGSRADCLQITYNVIIDSSQLKLLDKHLEQEGHIGNSLVSLTAGTESCWWKVPLLAPGGVWEDTLIARVKESRAGKFT